MVLEDCVTDKVDENLRNRFVECNDCIVNFALLTIVYYLHFLYCVMAGLSGAHKASAPKVHLAPFATILERVCGLGHQACENIAIFAASISQS